MDQFTLVGALIRGWRKNWPQGEFPFLYVQKISGSGATFDLHYPLTKEVSKFSPLPAQVPADGASRELHGEIAQHPHTAMVAASDLGGMTHLLMKSSYGERGRGSRSAWPLGKRWSLADRSMRNTSSRAAKCR